MKSLLWYGLAACTLCGCNEEPIAERPTAPPELNEPLVRVPSGRVVSGFKHGRLRQEFDVGGFRISRSPTTVAQFRACIDAGQCSSPALACSNPDGDDHDVALCVGYENAEGYCSWSQGRLPRLNEWLLAARGRDAKRFSWGNGAATCEQHPLSRGAGGDPDPATRARTGSVSATKTACGEPLKNVLRVGKHREGASPSGLEDVLLSRAELLTGHPETNFSACMSEGRGCLVHGLIPGSIDAVRPVRETRATSETERAGGKMERAIVGGTGNQYAFRCVWSEEGV